MKEQVVDIKFGNQRQTDRLSQTQTEQLLQQFVETPLLENEILSWKAKWQIFVKNRLTKTNLSAHFHSLNISAESLIKQKKRGEETNTEKEKLLSALLLYDVYHRDEIPYDETRYNKTVFIRFLLTHQKDDNQLGETAKNCIDQLSLKELSDPILNTPRGVSTEIRDKILIGEVAITRLGKETDLAKTILDSIVTNFIRNPYQDLSRVQSTTYTAAHSLLRYSPELADYIVQKLAIENHQLLSQFFSIYERYNDKNKSDRKDWQERDIIYNIKQTFDRSSCLKSLYNEYKEKARLQELEKIEQAQKTRLEKDEQMHREAEERTRQRRVKKVDELIEELPNYQIRPNNIYTKRDNNDKMILLHPYMSELIRTSHATYSLSSLNEEIMLLLTTKDMPEEKIVQLGNIWGKTSKQMVQNIEKIYREQTPTFVQHGISHYGLLKSDNLDGDSIEAIYNSFCLRLDSFSDQLEQIHNEPTSSDAIDHPLLASIESAYQERVTNIVDAMKLHQPKFEKICVNLKAHLKEQKYQADEEPEKQKEIQLLEEQKRHEKEKQEEIQETKKDYLLQEIERKTDYLKTLYQLHTGLNLHDVDAEALDEDGTTIGSVSIGVGQNLRLTQKQELTIEQKLEWKKEDAITLEMGKNLEEIIKRHTMVDWVAPHEIAHLIDWSSDHFTEKVLHTNIAQSKIDDLADTFPPAQQSLAKEMITQSIKESFIDGVAFYCGMTYGTSNITHDDDQSKREKDLATAFCTTMEIGENIIRKEAQDKETQSRYQMILLRFIATANHLTKNAETNNVSDSLATLSVAKNTLSDCFYELNENTRFISEEQKEKLVDLFYQWFKYGKSFLKKEEKETTP